MGQNRFLLFFLISLAVVGSLQAQRDGRRRSGRRKPTSLPPTEAPLSESTEGKPEPTPEEINAAKSGSVAAGESEANGATTPVDKHEKQRGGSPGQFLPPRGTRKPRPVPVRSGSRESKPKPTLPTFVRKAAGRTRKPTTPAEEGQVTIAPPPSNKLGKVSSRRRNSNGAAAAGEATSEAPPVPSEAPSHARNKKRFGGGEAGSPVRRPSRGSRRGTTEEPEN